MVIIYIHNIDLEIDDNIYNEITNNNIENITKLYDDSNVNLYIGYLKRDSNYYYKALEQDNKLSYHFLGFLYYNTDINNAIEYFTLAIEHDKYNVDTIYYLARSYHLKSNIQDFEKAKYYYLLAIEHGDKCAMRMLERITEDDIKFYNLLTKSKKNNLINKWIKILENKNEIKIYKIENNLVKYGYNKCNACLENYIYVMDNYCERCFFTEQNLY